MSAGNTMKQHNSQMPLWPGYYVTSEANKIAKWPYGHGYYVYYEAYTIATPNISLAQLFLSIVKPSIKPTMQPKSISSCPVGLRSYGNYTLISTQPGRSLSSPCRSTED